MRVPRRLVLALLVGTGVISSSAGSSPSNPTAAQPVADPARGLVYQGLRPAQPGGDCGGQGFELKVAGGGPTPCTHGPDPAPAGVDVRVLDPTGTAMGAPASGSTLAASTAVTCVGNGTDGKRVQALYVHGPSAPVLDAGRLSSIRTWAAAADDTFANSAAETGGNRRLRWATDAGCNLDVIDVKLPTAGALSSMNTTIDAVSALGFNRADRKYVMWADDTTYCGIATFYNDDRPGLENYNNGAGASYARTDRGCWGQTASVEAHEIMHMLGAVQRSAPHSTANGHCTDEYDRMCYKDGTGVVMTYPCASAGEYRFDCDHDDYFHTNPSSGSYLATHWNAANSGWLYEPGGSTPPPPPPPGGTVTDTLTGTTRAGRITRRTIAVGAGTTTVKLTLGNPQSVVLKLVNSAGLVVAKQSGTTPVQLTKDLAAGTYTVTFKTSRATSYTLEVIHPPAT